MRLSRRTSRSKAGPSPGRTVRGYAALLAASVLVACGTSTPPPRAAEVPIDQFQAGPAPPDKSATADPAGGGGEGTTGTEGAAASGGGPVTTSSPTPLATETGAVVPSAAGGSGTLAATARPRPAKGQRLTSTECNRLLDKYVVLVAAGQGMTSAQALRALPALKVQVQSDPNYAGAQSTCLEQNSKKQYQCAVKATTVDVWKACLE